MANIMFDVKIIAELLPIFNRFILFVTFRIRDMAYPTGHKMVYD